MQLAPCSASQLLSHSFLGKGTLQRFGISSSASPELNVKDINQSKDEQGSVAENDGTSQNVSQIKDQNERESGSSSDPKPAESVSGKKRRGSSTTKRAAFSDSDTESDLSFDDLVKLVAEKEELLKAKHKEIEKMQDKVLRSYAEMENVIERTKREAENTKKFAIQVCIYLYIHRYIVRLNKILEGPPKGVKGWMGFMGLCGWG